MSRDRPRGPRGVHPRAVDRGRRPRRRGALRHEDRPVVLRQGSLLAASFHPELVGETELHDTSSPSRGRCDVRSFEVGDDQAEEGRERRQALQPVREAPAAVEVAAKEGGGDPTANMTLASASRRRRRPRSERQHRSRDQAGERRRRERARYEEVTLRRLRARRDRSVRRGTHGQPQPDGAGRATRVHAQRRQPRRDGLDGVDVHAQGRDRRGEGRGARRGALVRARDRGRRRGPERRRAHGRSSPTRRRSARSETR